MITTAELAAAGVSDARIRTLVRQGVLLPLIRGVYADAGLARVAGPVQVGPNVLRVAAGVTITGPGAVGSFHDAAAIHGLDLLDKPPAGLVALSRPLGAPGSRTGRPGIRVHTAALPRRHVVVRHGALVTSVARTVVDLARTSDFRAGVVVADSALRRRLTTKTELRSVISICARWPGIRRAREVVDFGDGKSESAFESIARVVFRDEGLPPPQLQVWVGGGGSAIGRVDFLWREHRTIAEADGAVKYADPRRAREQLHRDARLREAGFEVVHFSWQGLHVAPGQVAASIRTAFRRGDTT